MRNAERAKEDTERRNEMLQRAKEEFFGTFGEMHGWKINRSVSLGDGAKLGERERPVLGSAHAPVEVKQETQPS